MKTESFLFQRWPRYAYRHAGRVILAAVAIIVALGVSFALASGEYANDFSVAGSEAQELFDTLEERFPSNAGDQATVVVKADAGLDDPTVSADVATLVSRLETLPEVTGVQEPAASDISADGTIARINVQYGVQAADLELDSAEALVNLVEEESRPGFQVEAGGQPVSATEEVAIGPAEAIGIAAAIVILLIAFGSIVAMGVPILTALLGLAAGFFLIGIGTNFANLPEFTPQFGAMIGLGVGIDYSLLVVSRFREGVSRGLSVENATVEATNTAGRAVFFAGGTVIIALLGLWASGITAVGWVGTASAVLVAIMVSIALLVLPAVLRYAGPYIDRWRVPGLKSPSVDSHTGLGYRWSRVVQKRAVLCLVVSVALLLLFAGPILGLRLASSDAGNNPESFTSRRAYDLISEGFGPGANGPIVVGAIVEDPNDAALVEGLPEFLAAQPEVREVLGLNMNAEGTAGVISVIPESAPQDEATVDMVNDLRDALRTEFTGTGVTPLVGGSTALTVDVASQQASRLPIFMGAVILLSFLLLMAVFRSIVVPLQAAAMNLLSVAASIGILVAIFQWGWLAGPLGVSAEGPIEPFLPMMLFAVLFGLSMDYEVFLVSRIREEYLATGDNSEAVSRGLSVTSRVITAAAAIMVSVFASFAINDDRIIKQFGIGLSVAVLLDATIVRLVLIPSLMQLSGKWNWWLPSWLDRALPRISVDGPTGNPSGQVGELAPIPVRRD